jgi:hypothetical protein
MKIRVSLLLDLLLLLVGWESLGAKAIVGCANRTLDYASHTRHLTRMGVTGQWLRLLNQAVGFGDRGVNCDRSMD